MHRPAGGSSQCVSALLYLLPAWRFTTCRKSLAPRACSSMPRGTKMRYAPERASDQEQQPSEGYRCLPNSRHGLMIPAVGAFAPPTRANWRRRARTNVQNTAGENLPSRLTHFTTPLSDGAFSFSLEGVEFYHGSPYDGLVLRCTRRQTAIGPGQRVAVEGHRWLT